jgi:hypothetical protein
MLERAKSACSTLRQVGSLGRSAHAMMPAMRTPLFLALTLMVAACSAESAPDNAAGSIKQAPTQPDIKVQPEGIVPVEDGTTETDEAKAKKTPCPPPSASTCEDPDKEQKWCHCRKMRQNLVYPCGCMWDEPGGTTGPIIIEGPTTK